MRRFQRQPKKYRAIGSAGTSSWQFHRLTKIELQLVGKRPLSVVGNRGRFDHTLRLIWIDIEKGQARQIAKVIDDDFLLFWIINIETPHINAIDHRAAWADGFRSRSSCRCGWARRTFQDALLLLPHTDQLP